MSPETVGALGLVVMLVLMGFGMPIAFAMVLIGFAGLSVLTSPSAALFMLSDNYYFQFSSYTMLVIPLFVLMGEIAFHSGMSKRIFRTAHTWIGFIPGGLAVATIGACAGFAAICGSSTATAATMGTVALPEMEKQNYDKAFSTGTVAAGGTLGILIPPSIVLIIYGTQTELSIGKLFIAGMLPGLVLSALFVVGILVMCTLKPSLGAAAPATSLREKIGSLSGTVEMALLFCLVIGGLLFGWFTPTEAAGIGAAGSIVIAMVRRSMSWASFKAALLGTTRTTAMVLMIMASAMIFSRFLTVSTLPQNFAQWVGGLDASPYAILVGIMAVYIIGGCLMDALSFLIITINIFFPIIVNAGFDPIWFGVVIVILMETGAITPPVGLNVYVIKGIVQDVALQDIFRGVFPYLMLMFLGLLILTVFPQIALYLPGLVK